MHKDLVDAHSSLFFFALEGNHPVVPVEDGSESHIASMGSLEGVECYAGTRSQRK